MKNTKVWAIPLTVIWIITITLYLLNSNSDNKNNAKKYDPHRPEFLYVDQLHGMEVYDNYPCNTEIKSSEEIKTVDRIPQHKKGIVLYANADKRSKLFKKLPYHAEAEVLEIIDNADVENSEELEWKQILFEKKKDWVYEPSEKFNTHWVK